MTLFRDFVAVVVAAATGCMIATAAGAETQLTDFNGEWRGEGKDRNGPLEFMRSTDCQTSIRATLQRMRTEMTCERPTGLRKAIRMMVEVDGDRLNGKIIQRLMAPGSTEPRSMLTGTLSGQKTDTTANFQVRWSGPTPNANVALTLLSPSSFAMHVTVLGITMMDVTFSRTASSSRQPAPP